MSYEVMAIGKLVASPWNPRRSVDAGKLAELQASIKEHGIIEPLVVRKKKTPAKSYEIVCGGRRYRCAVSLKLTAVPVVVRELSDQAALEMAVVENIQDEDLHPLDEAAAYAVLLKDTDGATHVSVGRRCGKTPAHIFKRCQLLKLHVSVREAFAANRITAGHADRLTRVPVAKQEEALEKCFHPLFRSYMLDKDAEQMEPAPVADLDEWIARHVKEEIDDDAVTHVFPELAAQSEADHPEDVVPTLIQLSDSSTPGANLGTKKHGLVGRTSWTVISTAKDRCDFVVQGVVVHGGRVRVLTVCAKRGCPKHRPPKPKPKAGGKTSAKPSYQVEQERRQREELAWRALEPKILAAFVEQVKTQKVTAALVEATIGYDCKLIMKILKVKALTASNMGQAMAIKQVLGCWNQRQFIKAAKPFGFKPQAVLAAHKRDLVAAVKTAKKTTPAKASRTTRKTTKRATKS